MPTPCRWALIVLSGVFLLSGCGGGTKTVSATTPVLTPTTAGPSPGLREQREAERKKRQREREAREAARKRKREEAEARAHQATRGAAPENGPITEEAEEAEEAGKEAEEAKEEAEQAKREAEEAKEEVEQR